MQRGRGGETGTGREEGSERMGEGREVSRSVGDGGARGEGECWRKRAAGVARERGCGRTDLLPGSHVPPARNRGVGTGEDRNDGGGGRERRRAVEGGVASALSMIVVVPTNAAEAYTSISRALGERAKGGRG